MSAALQLTTVWGASNPSSVLFLIGKGDEERQAAQVEEVPQEKPQPAEQPSRVATYRKHTESLLRRYLYTSMHVGRTPSILGDVVARGRVSSRPVRTFEDAVIFVLDVETCLDKLGGLERALLSRIVLQEYTQCEAAPLLGMSVRAVTYSFPLALDRLTELLLQSNLLVAPRSQKPR